MNIAVSDIFAILAIGIGTTFFTGLIIGRERKARWFRQRTKNSIFLRRGLLGEACHFGYPCTKEGYSVTLAMLLVIIGLSMIFLKS